MASKVCLSAGIDRGELRRDLMDRLLGVARVVPPVRVVLGGLGTARLARKLHRHRGAEIDHLRVAAAVRDHLVHPRVEVVAVGEDELRVGRVGDVVRPRLVVMRVGVRREDLVDVHVVAADLADEVADLRRGRHDGDLAASSTRSSPQPATSSVATRAPASARVPRRAPDRPCDRRDAEDRPAERGDRRAGRRIGLHREPEPDGALRRGEQDARRSARRASGWRTAGRLPRAPRRSRRPAGRRSR